MLHLSIMESFYFYGIVMLENHFGLDLHVKGTFTYDVTLF